MITRRIVLFFFLISFIGFSSEYDWGKTGHRATGEIANTYLTNKARKNIDRLLKGKSLAFVSTFADEIKSDDSYRGYSPWHYVNFSFDKKYGEETPSEYGDLIKGIEKCVEVLKDKSATDKDKEFYLKMLVHFIGDLHQPLHVGRGEDKGGNDIQVRWFRDGSNLHRVWDSNMIDYYGMSYTELSKNTDRLSKAQLQVIENGDVLDWVHESQTLAKKVYASANTGEKLGYKYMYNYFPMVRSQLQKGGVRLAKILNEIFG
ncbi:S1/P1 nuclease [Aquimarina sp. 2201CG5-10]|uniref:S1/P1 nuclease n=1 Tax=Aquimarina callyspongiae TaxID=3098150 RepID=UPI002AB4375C|nr:S1/P1 nuclease [Aquimarina sp. 2201CG5-10]MDY8137887.1 S1/P1 nuclease [Aquimarina sp. 2201CG5-10]